MQHAWALQSKAAAGVQAHQEGQRLGGLEPHRLLQRCLDAGLKGSMCIKVGGCCLGLQGDIKGG